MTTPASPSLRAETLNDTPYYYNERAGHSGYNPVDPYGVDPEQAAREAYRIAHGGLRAFGTTARERSHQNPNGPASTLHSQEDWYKLFPGAKKEDLIPATPAAQTLGRGQYGSQSQVYKDQTGYYTLAPNSDGVPRKAYTTPTGQQAANIAFNRSANRMFETDYENLSPEQRAQAIQSHGHTEGVGQILDNGIRNPSTGVTTQTGIDPYGHQVTSYSPTSTAEANQIMNHYGTKNENGDLSVQPSVVQHYNTAPASQLPNQPTLTPPAQQFHGFDAYALPIANAATNGVPKGVTTSDPTAGKSFMKPYPQS